MILPARLTLELPWPAHGPSWSRNGIPTDSFFLRGAKHIARTLADGYVASAQWIQGRLQPNPQDGQGEWPRHEIDLLCCVSIPALTQIETQQNDRTMLLAWRGDLQVLCDLEAAGGSSTHPKGDPKVPGRS